MKNYTSTIPASRSIAYIEKYLADCGALSISKHYDGFGGVASLFFQIETPENKVISFRLPANIDACFGVLWKAVKKPRADTEKKLRAQAERTAWKITSDWVEIQMSLIEMGQGEFMQLFLAHIWVGNSTFYNKLKTENFKMLTEN